MWVVIAVPSFAVVFVPILLGDYPGVFKALCVAILALLVAAIPIIWRGR